MTYQWFENGLPLTAATNSSLVLSNVPFSKNGYTYSVAITNAYGNVTSDGTATLTVVQGPPTLTTDISPLNITAFAGMGTGFSVGVNGSAPFHYQWLRNGGNITNATNATYNFTILAGTNTYSCTVTNGGGSISSSTATVIGIDAANPVTSFAINFHDYANFANYYSGNGNEFLLYVGQGAYADSGNNIWNGFGDTVTSGIAALSSSGALTPVTFSINIPDGDNGGLYNQDNGSGGNSLQGTPGFLLGNAALAANGGANTGTFTFNNVPSGNYDLYAYAANYDGDRGARFTVNGTTQTVNNNPSVTGQHPPTNFVNGVTYVVFHNLIPTNGVVTGTWDGNFTNPNTGQSGEGDLAGLQLVKVSVTQSPWLSISRSGNQAIISWSPAVGQLQSAGSVNGTYTNVPAATSPYTNTLSGSALFYRVRVE
jgi:hypothetical protein